MLVRIFGLMIVLGIGASFSQQPVWRDVMKLEAPDAARLERQLAANPEDLAARATLMGYYRRADRYGNPEDRSKLAQHMLWLIGHHPESKLLRISPGHQGNDNLARAAALWDAAVRAHPRDAAVLWNAATYFGGVEPALHLHYLEAAVAADPNHPLALRPLAHLYALTMLEKGALTPRARAGLEASQNVWVLGNAAYMFQSHYNLGLEAGRPDARAAAWAERYFLRARALDPKLDRRTILPEIDLAGKARARAAEAESSRAMQAQFDRAAASIARLDVDAFPELPPAIAGVLRSRGCTVPQLKAGGRARRNVVRGEFFAKGESGWAVLCSVKGSSSILVFRHDRDPRPDSLASGEDRVHLQGMGGDEIAYSREITAVGRDFIVGHHRAYGGPQPPPIDHHGIDDAFVGKASVTRYFHGGRWLSLQGAD